MKKRLKENQIWSKKALSCPKAEHEEKEVFGADKPFFKKKKKVCVCVCVCVGGVAEVTVSLPFKASTNQRILIKCRNGLNNMNILC